MEPLPAHPSTVALFVSSKAFPDGDAASGIATSSIDQLVAAIGFVHRAAKQDSPCGDQLVKDVVDAARRRRRVVKRKDALTPKHLQQIVATFDSSALGIRSRALVLLGFTGGFRRSELAALDVEDIAFVERGLEVTVRSAKSDQFGEGLTKAICYSSNKRYCPVEALKEHIASNCEDGGALFRSHSRSSAGARLSGRSIARIVTRAAKDAGIEDRDYSAHSLRAGCVTTAIQNGAHVKAVMDLTGHRSVETMNRYVRAASLWDEPASGTLGL